MYISINGSILKITSLQALFTCWCTKVSKLLLRNTSYVVNHSVRPYQNVRPYHNVRPFRTIMSAIAKVSALNLTIMSAQC